MKSRQAMLAGNYARTMETNFGVVGEIAGLAMHNLPLDELDKFIPSVSTVTGSDITAFTNKYLGSPGALVIAGKAAAFLDALKKDVADSRVIPQNQLDLNSAGLVKPK